VTAAPKHGRRSPAQVRAGRAFAAGGRAAQASRRSAAIAKTGKPPPRSKRQKAASRAWAAAGRAAQAARRAGKKPAPHKKAAMPSTGMYRGTVPECALWLPGCNDERPVCAVTAVANHLLAATGIAASDAEMLAVHELAGGDDGARIETILDAAVHYGLAGVRLAFFGLADEVLPGMVCGISTRRGYHAVLAHPYGMVSWGLLVPRQGTPEEAWILTWEVP
jgi:hypothetical protein